MSGFIAVHCGAGYHGEKFHQHYNKLSRQACRIGGKVLNDGGSALEAVKTAVSVLEDNPLTNAGFGSNLTFDGNVECDASIMDGRNLLYGGCGAVQKVKNPIELAYNLCTKQTKQLPLGLVPPSLLVGSGALKYAKEVSVKTVSRKRLVTDSAYKRFKKYKAMLNNRIASNREAAMDTVGAVCIDKDGHVAAACSSGGLILKKPGRVGQAAIYACGVWADSFDHASEAAVAVSTSGCGEHLMRTELAKEIGKDLKTTCCPITALHKSMVDNFVDSRYLRNVAQKVGGALVLHVSPMGEGHLLWGHSSETMSVGYMNCNDNKPKSFISKLPKEITVGTNISVSGTNFILSN